jgi:hypothetical protein
MTAAASVVFFPSFYYTPRSRFVSLYSRPEIEFRSKSLPLFITMRVQQRKQGERTKKKK